MYVGCRSLQNFILALYPSNVLQFDFLNNSITIEHNLYICSHSHIGLKLVQTLSIFSYLYKWNCLEHLGYHLCTKKGQAPQIFLNNLSKISAKLILYLSNTKWGTLSESGKITFNGPLAILTYHFNVKNIVVLVVRF